MAWYVALVIVLYLVYLIIFYKVLDKKNKLMYIGIISLLVYAACYAFWLAEPKWYRSIEIALTRIPVFLLGCYCGELVYKDMKILSMIKIGSFIVLLLGIVYFYEYPVPITQTGRTAYLLVGPSIVIWLAVFFDFVNNTKLNNF